MCILLHARQEYTVSAFQTINNSHHHLHSVTPACAASVPAYTLRSHPIHVTSKPMGSSPLSCHYPNHPDLYNATHLLAWLLFVEWSFKMSGVIYPTAQCKCPRRPEYLSSTAVRTSNLAVSVWVIITPIQKFWHSIYSVPITFNNSCLKRN